MSAPSPADGATPATRVTTDYAYDADGHLCRVLENASVSLAALADPCTDALPGGTAQTTTENVETRYSYDDSGNLASQFSAGDASAGDLAGTTSYLYDAEGRLTSQTDPDGNTTTFSYDAWGNKASETDPGPDGGTTYWFYDTADRLCQRAALADGATYTAPSQPCADAVTGATIDTFYAYDAAGDQTSAKDALSGETISSSFDAAGRPLSVTDTGGAASVPATTYAYGFAAGTSTDRAETRTDPSGSYAFDTDPYGRQSTLIDTTQVSHPSGDPFVWTYDATGAVLSAVAPTGNVTSYTYDPLGRLSASEHDRSVRLRRLRRLHLCLQRCGRPDQRHQPRSAATAPTAPVPTPTTRCRALRATPRRPHRARRPRHTAGTPRPDRTSHHQRSDRRAGHHHLRPR